MIKTAKGVRRMAFDLILGMLKLSANTAINNLKDFSCLKIRDKDIFSCLLTVM